MIQQFAVCRLRGGREDRLVVVLQSHLLDDLDTAIVAPLLTAPAPAKEGVDITVEVGGVERRLALSQLAAVPHRALKAEGESVSGFEDEIRRAIDRLFTGF